MIVIKCLFFGGGVKTSGTILRERDILYIKKISFPWKLQSSIACNSSLLELLFWYYKIYIFDDLEMVLKQSWESELSITSKK